MDDLNACVDSKPSSSQILVIWAAEICAEALGTAILLFIVGAAEIAIHDGFRSLKPPTWSETGRFLLYFPLGILMFFCTSGYIVVTCLWRFILRNKTSFLPPACAASYILLAELLFQVLMTPPSEGLVTHITVLLGGLLTYGCVFLGNRALRDER